MDPMLVQLSELIEANGLEAVLRGIAEMLETTDDEARSNGPSALQRHNSGVANMLCEAADELEAFVP